MSETPEQMIERVRRMAEGKRSLLFDNDHAALRYVLAEAESARQLAEALEEVTGTYNGGASNALEDEYVMARCDAALAAWKARVGA